MMRKTLFAIMTKESIARYWYWGASQVTFLWQAAQIKWLTFQENKIMGVSVYTCHRIPHP